MELFLIQTVAAGQWTLKKCGTYPIEVPKFMLTLFYHFIQIHERNGLSQKNDFLKKNTTVILLNIGGGSHKGPGHLGAL